MPHTQSRTAILLILLSTTLALVAAEIGYRVYLGIFPVPPLFISYQVVGESTSVFEADTGYDYRPNAAIPMATVQEGVVVGCNIIRSDAHGNIGTNTPIQADHSLRVLVVGDSFSDNMQLNGATWPAHFEDLLASELGHPVQVLNYSRSGFGVLQMVAMARKQAERLKPDVIVLPFIMHDLTRPRFWRTNVNMNGVERLLQLDTPDADPTSPRASVDVSLVDEGVTEAWCTNQLRQPNAADPLLVRLNQRFVDYAVDNHRSSRLWTLSKSFLFNRIVHADYSGRIANQHRTPPLDLNDFGDDPRFTADSAALKSLNIPIHLIRLPLHEELEQNTYVAPTEQQHSLLKSLEDATGTVVIELLPLHEAPTDTDQYYLLPYDLHPSLKGIELFAELVTAAMKPRIQELAPSQHT